MIVLRPATITVVGLRHDWCWQDGRVARRAGAGLGHFSSARAQVAYTHGDARRRYRRHMTYADDVLVV